MKNVIIKKIIKYLFLGYSENSFVEVNFLLRPMCLGLALGIWSQIAQPELSAKWILIIILSGMVIEFIGWQIGYAIHSLQEKLEKL